MAGNRHGSGFTRMMELAMTAFLTNLHPAVGFDQRNKFSDFHVLQIRMGLSHPTILADLAFDVNLYQLA
jgi:hypothetical protein